MSRGSFNDRAHATAAAASHAQFYAMFVAAVFQVPIWLGLHSGLLNVLATTVAAAWGVTLVADFLHQQSTALCLRCINDVPVDAPVRAERRKWALRFHHFTAERTGQVTGMLIIFVPNLLVLAMHPAPTMLGAAPGLLWSLSAIISSSQHRRLRPWCPYCRWDEDGDHEPSPDPVTFGTKTTH